MKDFLLGWLKITINWGKKYKKVDLGVNTEVCLGNVKWDIQKWACDLFWKSKA